MKRLKPRHSWMGGILTGKIFNLTLQLDDLFKLKTDPVLGFRKFAAPDLIRGHAVFHNRIEAPEDIADEDFKVAIVPRVDGDHDVDVADAGFDAVIDGDFPMG